MNIKLYEYQAVSSLNLYEKPTTFYSFELLYLSYISTP